MKKKGLTTINTKGMSREDWLAQREFGIGGSDVGSVFLMDRFKPAIKLFHQKVGIWQTDESDNLPAFFGRNMEDFIYHTCWKYWDPYTHDPEDMIRNNESDNIIRKAKRRNAIIINDEHPWLRANIDYEMNKWEDRGNGILELKTGNSKYWGQYEAELPTTYIFQIQMYMLVTGYEYGEIFGLIDGRAPKMFPIEASPQMHERILEEPEKFWQNVEAAKEIWRDESISKSERLKLISPYEPETEDTEALQM
jgi:predicted phage-related endonuclease